MRVLSVFWQVVLQHITVHILCFYFYLDPAQRAGFFVRVDGSLKVAAALICIHVYLNVCIYIYIFIGLYIRYIYIINREPNRGP